MRVALPGTLTKLKEITVKPGGTLEREGVVAIELCYEGAKSVFFGQTEKGSAFCPTCCDALSTYLAFELSPSRVIGNSLYRRQLTLLFRVVQIIGQRMS